MSTYGTPAWAVVGFTFIGEFWCPECTDEDARDEEGNEPQAIFDCEINYSEFDASCMGCGATIGEDK